MPLLYTTVFLVRHGDTDWTRGRKVLGRRDIELSEIGRAQADEVAARLKALELSEILTSPLLRAVETAEKIAVPHGIEVARDPRLTDLQAGKWEGKSYDEVWADAEYQAFLRDPHSPSIPGGEPLEAIRDRVVTSLEQALEDNEIGSNIAVVSHAGVVRVLLAHFLGMSIANYHRLRVGPASISVLRFDSDRELPRVLAVNHNTSLETILG